MTRFNIGISAAPGQLSPIISAENVVSPIVDTSILPEVFISNPEPRVVQGTYFAEIIVSLSHKYQDELLVDYTTEDISAMFDVDYGAQTGTLTFAPGEICKIVRVPILPTPEPIPFVIITPGSQIVECINPDENPIVPFSIELSAPYFSGPLTIDVSTYPDTALANIDYVPLIDAPVTFLPGEIAKIIEVQVICGENCGILTEDGILIEAEDLLILLTEDGFCSAECGLLTEDGTLILDEVVSVLLAESDCIDVIPCGLIAEDRAPLFTEAAGYLLQESCDDP